MINRFIWTCLLSYLSQFWLFDKIISILLLNTIGSFPYVLNFEERYCADYYTLISHSSSLPKKCSLSKKEFHFSSLEMAKRSISNALFFYVTKTVLDKALKESLSKKTFFLDGDFHSNNILQNVVNKMFVFFVFRNGLPSFFTESLN